MVEIKKLSSLSDNGIDRAVTEGCVAGRKFHGFGHRFHKKVEDPRVTAILEMIKKTRSGGRFVKTFCRIKDRLHRDKQIWANLDGVAAAVLLELGFEPEMADLFVILGRAPAIASLYAERRAAARENHPKVKVFDVVKSPRVTAVIPTRGGSRGLPGKNMQLFNGKPLLQHTIEAAIGSRLIDETVVSTDDDAIAALAKQLGCHVLRHPSELSKDNSPSFPVVRWVLKQLTARQKRPDVLIVARATAPLRTASDFDAAIKLFLESPRADSVASVVRTVVHPMKLKVVRNGYLKDAFEQEGGTPVPRQQLGEELFVRNEALYVLEPRLVEAGKLWGECCKLYIMDKTRSVNINDQFDFEMAELLHGT